MTSWPSSARRREHDAAAGERCSWRWQTPACRPDGRETIELSVNAANAPALALYEWIRMTLDFRAERSVPD